MTCDGSRWTNNKTGKCINLTPYNQLAHDMYMCVCVCVYSSSTISSYTLLYPPIKQTNEKEKGKKEWEREEKKITGSTHPKSSWPSPDTATFHQRPS